MSGFMGGNPLGFGDFEETKAMKHTERERFLAQIESVVPWKALTNLIVPHYPKTGYKGAGLPIRWKP